MYMLHWVMLVAVREKAVICLLSFCCVVYKLLQYTLMLFPSLPPPPPPPPFLPPFSRESSPVRDGVLNSLSSTLPHKIAPLTLEAITRLKVSQFV